MPSAKDMVGAPWLVNQQEGYCGFAATLMCLLDMSSNYKSSEAKEILRYIFGEIVKVSDADKLFGTKMSFTLPTRIVEKAKKKETAMQIQDKKAAFDAKTELQHRVQQRQIARGSTKPLEEDDKFCIALMIIFKAYLKDKNPNLLSDEMEFCKVLFGTYLKNWGKYKVDNVAKEIPKSEMEHSLRRGDFALTFGGLFALFYWIFSWKTTTLAELPDDKKLLEKYLLDCAEEGGTALGLGRLPGKKGPAGNPKYGYLRHWVYMPKYVKPKVEELYVWTWGQRYKFSELLKDYEYFPKFAVHVPFT